MTDMDDVEDFSERFDELLAEADAAGVSTDAVGALLTMYLAGMRGRVRLPLSMEPGEARAFAETLRERVGETVEVELSVTEDVVRDVELQLEAFDDD